MNGGKEKKHIFWSKLLEQIIICFSHVVGIGVHAQGFRHMKKRKYKFLGSIIIWYTLKAIDLDCGVCGLDYWLYHKLLVMSPWATLLMGRNIWTS